MTEILECAITYPATETQCAISISRIDGRYWCEVASTDTLGIQMVDANSREQALMFGLALCGIAATVHDVNVPELNRGGA